MGMSLLDLGQFNDWNEKIEWLPMQTYVTINWWEGNDGLEVPLHVVNHGWMYRRHQHSIVDLFCALIGIIM